MQQVCFRVQNYSWTCHMIRDLKNYKALRTLWRHPRRPKLVDIVETCTALVKQRFNARMLVFNNYLPFMMLKIKQTICLFVIFKKRKKLELDFFFKVALRLRIMQNKQIVIHCSSQKSLIFHDMNLLIEWINYFVMPAKKCQSDLWKITSNLRKKGGCAYHSSITIF